MYAIYFSLIRFAMPLELGRSGRVLGRCHAALGQNELSAAAFDASINLARTGRLLMSEALGVRGRWLAGREVAEAGTEAAGAGKGGQWDEATGRARLAEVVGRMGAEEGRAALGQALGGLSTE